MKLALVLLLSAPLWAQRWGREQALRPWLEGRFTDAEMAFARMRGAPWMNASSYLWEAEFETDRGRFRAAAVLLAEARRLSGSGETLWRRQALLQLASGQIHEAERTALHGLKWDGKNAEKLGSLDAIFLAVLGEVEMAKGENALALSIFEKARRKARNVSTYYGLEWCRAQTGMAIASIRLGSAEKGRELAAEALAAAGREWGPDSVPATDAQDALALAQVALKDLQGAEQSIWLSWSRREAFYDIEHPKVVQSFLRGAMLRARQDQRAEALLFLRRGLEIEKSMSVGPNARWAGTLLDAAEIYARLGADKEAMECYDGAIPVLESEFGPDIPRLVEARQRRAKLKPEVTGAEKQVGKRSPHGGACEGSPCSDEIFGVPGDAFEDRA